MAKAVRAAHRITLTFALEKSLKLKLSREAKERGLSMSHLICLILKDGLADHRQFNAMMAHPEIRKNLVQLFSNPDTMHAVADVLKSTMTPEKIQQQVLDFMDDYKAK